MAEEEKYNPETDSWEKKEPFKGKIVEPVYVAGQPIGFKPIEQKPFGRKQMAILGAKLKKEDIAKSKIKPKPSQLKGIIGGYLGVRKSRPIKDRLKVMRLQNMLDKKRLLNQIEKLKLAKQIETLRKKGILKQIISAPIRMPQQIYPAYATPEIMGDIDSMYADIGHADNNLWGEESWFGGENYYTEEYFDKELSLSPWEHLSIYPKQNLSPLLW